MTIGLLTIALLSGCAAPTVENYIELERAAPPEIVALDGKPKLVPAGFIKRRLRLGYPTLKEILIGDLQYMYITEKWFMDVLNWTEYFIRVQVPDIDSLQERPAAYEETVTILMSNLANLSVAGRYNIKASVLIGMVIANSDKPWEKIEADGKPRQYIIGMTQEGSIIYDLPTGQFINGSDFPNLDSMTGIMF
jgi:hypothetical protein